MGRPELSRSGHTTLGEHAVRNQVDPPEVQHHDSAGHIPPGNEPPLRPGVDDGPPVDESAESEVESELPLGKSKAAQGSATIALQLRVGDGFSEGERPDIVRRFASLDARLLHYAAVDVDMELSIKDRNRHGQKVTLECWIARMPRLVATSFLDDVDSALNEVRDDLRRQINDAKTKSEPRNSRQHRAERNGHR